MTYPTYGALVSKVQADYDIADENFISAAELLTLFNEGIKDVERIIHELHHEDKYFLVNGAITLANGTSDYSLPADIFANKIRTIWYENGTRKYEITKVRDIKDVKWSATGNSYEFLLINTTAGIKLRLYPTPTESGAYVKLFYVRECRRFVASTIDATNTLEIPAGENLVIQHVKRGCARKMRNPNMIAMEDGFLTQQLDLFQASLKEMVPDTNNLVPLDLNSYVSQGMLDIYNGGY